MNEETNYSPYQQRVINERTELNEKLKKLNDFLKCSYFSELSSTIQSLLLVQSSVMSAYSQILTARIDLFEEPIE